MMKFVRKFKNLEIQGKKTHQYDNFSRKYRLRKLKITILLCLVLASANAIAGPCDSILENDKLTSCLAEEFQNADALLNQRYAVLRKSMNKEQRELIRKAQTAWVTVRDADCELRASAVAGGQAYEPVFLSCQTEKTLRRIEEFKALELL